MAKLIYSLDGAFLGEFPIESERMTIGRRSENDICIDNLAISGEHAVLVASGQDVFLEDMGSTNGTIVNGQTIKKKLLQHGDVIELGKYQLKYIDEAQGKPGIAAMDYEKTMIIRPAAKPEEHVPAPQAAPEAAMVQPPPVIANLRPDLPSWARPPNFSALAQDSPPLPVAGDEMPNQQPSASEEKPAQAISLARIQVQNGSNAGKELALSKDLTRIGRPGVQVAAISRRAEAYFVIHVEGTQRPLVNDKIVGDEAARLDDQDVIEIAGVKMKFHFFEI